MKNTIVLALLVLVTLASCKRTHVCAAYGPQNKFKAKITKSKSKARYVALR